jgi:hypothetical protein
VTQLVRAGAPGVPQRLFYGSIPAEGILAMYPTRGVPPFVIPQPSLFNVRVCIMIGHYERDGEIKIGGTALDSPSEREIARQERMKREG